MTFQFEVVETSAATASIKENAFVTLLDGAPSPFETLELNKSVKFDVPANDADEIKAAEKLKKDLGDHIRLIRPDHSPLVKSRDENGKRHFVATITKKVERNRKPAETPAGKGGGTAAKPAAAKAGK